MQRVLVLGASPKKDRFSNKAVRELLKNGHEVIPVHPTAEKVEGLKVISDLSKVEGQIDSLSLYLSPDLSSKQKDLIKDLNPKRVIFNPGTENVELERYLQKNGIKTQRACTLVLLASGRFEEGL